MLAIPHATPWHCTHGDGDGAKSGAAPDGSPSAIITAVQAKIKTLPELLVALAPIRARGGRVALTNGVFDLLHVGHLRYLQAARALADVLVVGLNADSTVRELKGPTRPLLPEEERAELLAGLACVDFVVVFAERTAEALVAAIRPEVYVKGGDYAAQELPEAEIARACGGEVRLLPLTPGRSTSALVARILQLHGCS